MYCLSRDFHRFPAITATLTMQITGSVLVSAAQLTLLSVKSKLAGAAISHESCPISCLCLTVIVLLICQLSKFMNAESLTRQKEDRWHQIAASFRLNPLTSLQVQHGPINLMMQETNYAIPTLRQVIRAGLPSWA